jgi:hypothetical protein
MRLAQFTFNNGSSILINPDAVVAVEEMDDGCRIYLRTFRRKRAIEVPDSLPQVVRLLSPPPRRRK